MPRPQHDLDLTQYENSDGVSDFPPIRICDSTVSTPDPPSHCSTHYSKQHSSPSGWASQSPQLLRSRLNKKGLKDKNILNVSVRQRRQAKPAKVGLQHVPVDYDYYVVDE